MEKIKVEPCWHCTKRNKCPCRQDLDSATGAWECEGRVMPYHYHAELCHAEVVKDELEIKLECTRYYRDKEVKLASELRIQD